MQLRKKDGVQPSMQRCPILRFLSSGLTIGFLWIGIAAAYGEPPAGPAPADGGANVRRPAPADPAEQERRRALNKALDARNQADLSRAAYESANKAGKPSAKAKDAFEQVVAAYEKAIDRPLASPEVIEVVAYCHLRLAGAYQYAQEFDKAVDQSKKAVHASAGTAKEIDATYAVGLIYLQAIHDPKEAMTWMKRTQDLTQTIVLDPAEQAKWFAATAEAIQRCEQEGKK